MEDSSWALTETARIKIYKIRTYATREGETKGKYLDLYEKMADDELCHSLFNYMENINNKKIRDCYNQYIRHSNLSKEEQDELII